MQIVKPLTDGEVEKIHEASLDVLENVGLRVEHTGLLERLRAAGAKVSDASGNVRLPASMVREAMAQVPSRHTICHVGGSEDIVEIGSRHWLGNVVLPRVVDIDSGRVRRPTMAEVRRNNIVAQKVDAVKAVYRMEAPALEEGTSSACLAGLEEYILNNGKHLVMFGTNMELLERTLAIGRIISESQGIPLSRLITSSCPISSPLKVPEFYGEYMVQSCEAGFAVFGTISPTAGSTGPYSLAGCLVLGNAENLFMATVSQIIKPGIPFLYMYSPSVADMRTGKNRFYSMDRSMARAVLGQMGRFYNVPFLGDCCGSMPPRHDVQTGAESMTAMLAAYAAGPSWMGAVGVSFNGMAFSAEMMLVHMAWLEAAQFLERGIPLDEQRLALASIERVGPGGDFLTDELTLQLLRGSEFFSSDLFDLTGGEDGTPILDKAREHVDAMVEEFESPVPHALQEKLRRYFHDERKKTEA